MSLYEKLKEHLGHNIVCVSYGQHDNIAIECMDCYAVLVDADRVTQ
jgi:hypothetical protein